MRKVPLAINEAGVSAGAVKGKSCQEANMDIVADRPQLRLTFAQFEAFRHARPKMEKWELIDGELIMMPPPALVHQRISGNIDRLLTARLELVRPDWRSDREIGVHVPNEDDYSPEPDVTVIDEAITLGQVYAERFYFVAEVLSRDRPDVLAKKRAYYMGHHHCRGFMFVKQNEVRAELVCRSAEGWITTHLTDPDAVIDIPDIGEIGRLRALYRSTPLEPK